MALHLRWRGLRLRSTRSLLRIALVKCLKVAERLTPVILCAKHERQLKAGGANLTDEI